MSLKAAVITASTNLDRAKPCIQSWRLGEEVPLVIVLNSDTGTEDNAAGAILSDLRATYLASRSYLGTVPAFRRGVDFALEHTEAEVLVCLHDDVEMLDPDWLGKTLRHFERQPACGLAGYGGAIGLGAEDIYQTPYNPMQLARVGFRSNLVDAEVHGIRSILSEKVACLDGFSQVGRRDFWAGLGYREMRLEGRPLTYLEDHGLVHHFYDGALGALAARYGWETWYLPVRCRHLGGQTAVGDAGYQRWAKTVIPGGDQGFWEQSHRRGYELFKDVLPLRV